MVEWTAQLNTVRLHGAFTNIYVPLDEVPLDRVPLQRCGMSAAPDSSAVRARRCGHACNEGCAA